MAKEVSVGRILKIIREALPLIILYSIIEIPAGGIFSRMEEEIRRLPGLLLMLPAIMDIRGDISSSYGARICTAYHMGIITPETGFNKYAMENASATLVLTFITSILSGALAWLITIFTGMPHIALVNFLIIALVVNYLAGFVLLSFSYFVAMTAARMKLDPNNVTVPAITALGDVITISVTLVVAKIMMGWLIP